MRCVYESWSGDEVYEERGVDEVCVWGWCGYSNGVISHT